MYFSFLQFDMDILASCNLKHSLSMLLFALCRFKSGVLNYKHIYNNTYIAADSKVRLLLELFPQLLLNMPNNIIQEI